MRPLGKICKGCGVRSPRNSSRLSSLKSFFITEGICQHADLRRVSVISDMHHNFAHRIIHHLRLTAIEQKVAGMLPVSDDNKSASNSPDRNMGWPATGSASSSVNESQTGFPQSAKASKKHQASAIELCVSAMKIST